MPKRKPSRYARLQALIRDPEYLSDLELFRKGYAPSNIKDKRGRALPGEDLPPLDLAELPNAISRSAQDWFSKKYKLSVPITPEQFKSRNRSAWNKIAVFTDDVYRVAKKPSPQQAITEKTYEIRKEEGLTSEYVFTYARRAIDRVDRAFRGALSRAGILDFRFHDLRHTAASHLVMRGASLKDVQEILGHKTMTMTLRYAYLSQEHKMKAVSLLSGLTSSVKFDMSQNGTNAPSTKVIPLVRF